MFKLDELFEKNSELQNLKEKYKKIGKYVSISINHIGNDIIFKVDNHHQGETYYMSLNCLKELNELLNSKDYL